MEPPRKPIQIKSKSKHLKQVDKNEICSESLLTAEFSYLLSKKPSVISVGHTLARGATLGYVTAHISSNFINAFSPLPTSELESISSHSLHISCQKAAEEILRASVKSLVLQIFKPR